MEPALTDEILLFHNFVFDFRALKASRPDGGLVDDWQTKVHMQRQEARAAREDDDEVESIQPPASIDSTLSNKRARSSTVAVVSTSRPLNPRSKKDSSSHRSETNIPQTQSVSGGLEDEDDTAEREVILSSPAKGKVRVSNSVSSVFVSEAPIKLGPWQHIVQVTSPEKKKKKNVSEFTYDDLPDGALFRWRHGFVTTFAYHLCCTRNPWNTSDRETFQIMQSCWDFVYGKNLPHAITGLRDVVYVLVSCYI